MAYIFYKRGMLMKKKKVKQEKRAKHFLKGYLFGAAFCGTIAFLLLIALWVFMQS